jgi:hypothetical protein
MKHWRSGETKVTLARLINRLVFEATGREVCSLSGGQDDGAGARRWTIVIAALILVQILGQPALGEPIYLACQGELRARNSGGVTRESFALTIRLDMTAKTAKIGDYEVVPVKTVVDKPDSVFFMTAPGGNFGVSTGGLNRYSGALWLHVISNNGLLLYDGSCKPAAKLF